VQVFAQGGVARKCSTSVGRATAPGLHDRDNEVALDRAQEGKTTMIPKLVRRATPWLAFALICAVPNLASAQTGAEPKSSGFSEQSVEGGRNVVFDDDKALGTAYDPFADIVRGPPRGARLMLLRPRYNFISEMLKSVENL
jgi:hypothetical protein